MVFKELKYCKELILNSILKEISHVISINDYNSLTRTDADTKVEFWVVNAYKRYNFKKYEILSINVEFNGEINNLIYMLNCLFTKNDFKYSTIFHISIKPPIFNSHKFIAHVKYYKNSLNQKEYCKNKLIKLGFYDKI